MSINMPEWLLAGGLVDMCLVFVLTCLKLRSERTDTGTSERDKKNYGVFLVISILCILAWAIVGILLLANVPDACRSENRTVWNMTIAFVAIQFLSVGAIYGEHADRIYTHYCDD